MQKLLLTILLASVLPSMAYAQPHWLDPSGGAAEWASCRSATDPGAGNRCTMAQANAGLAAGQTAYLKAGTYTTAISPANSGTSNNPLTYQVAPGEAQFSAIVTVSTGVSITGKNHITIDGLYFNGSSTRWATINTVDHVTIKNCQFYNAHQYSGIRLEAARYFKISNNVFLDAPIKPGWPADVWSDSCQAQFDAGTPLAQGCDWHTAPSDMLQVRAGSCCGLIEGNTFGRASHDAVNVLRGRWVTIRRNTFRNRLRRGVDIQGNGSGGWAETLVERNTFAESGQDWFLNPVERDRTVKGYTQQPCIQVAGKSIIRQNTFANSGTGFNLAGYSGYNGSHSRIYHNSLFQLDSSIALHGNNSETVTGIKMINNVVNAATKREVYNTTDYGAPLNYWINNAWTPGADTFFFKNTSTSNKCLEAGSTGDCSRGYLELLYPSEWHASNYYADPHWADAAQGDFTLTQSSSALIDAAAFLTTITSASGSGTTLTVDDPLYFYDGWKIPGEVGDTIYTSAGQSARISGIDYDTGALTLETSMSWTRGDGVTTIKFVGAAPDVGASEYGAPAPLHAPAAPQALRVLD